jgi:hypothetical protein
MTATAPTLQKLAFHNLDALVALLALPIFMAAGWPLEGWFWAVALWAVNRFLEVLIERRASQMTALRAVGTMGASMLLRPWIGMLILFLITRHDTALAVSSVLLFMVLVTIDIGTRIVTHRNFQMTIGGSST